MKWWFFLLSNVDFFKYSSLAHPFVQKKPKGTRALLETLQISLQFISFHFSCTSKAIISSFLKTGSFQCGAVDIKWLYEKHGLQKYGNTDLCKANFNMQQSTVLQRQEFVCILVMVKLYHWFLKYCSRILAMIQMYLQFLDHHVLQELCPVLEESHSVRRDSYLVRWW